MAIRRRLSSEDHESSYCLDGPFAGLVVEIYRLHLTPDSGFSCGDLSRLAFHSNAVNRREVAYRLAYEHSKNRSLSEHNQEKRTQRPKYTLFVESTFIAGFRSETLSRF